MSALKDGPADRSPAGADPLASAVVAPRQRARRRGLPGRPLRDAHRPHLLDRDSLSDRIDQLFRAAWRYADRDTTPRISCRRRSSTF